MNRRPKQAFTLIELLTVIAIIGILASILIPTVARVRESARRTVDASNLRQIGQASLVFANDNRDQLPYYGEQGGQNRSINLHGEVEEGGTTAPFWALPATLARFGGINDGTMWVSASDGAENVDPNLSVILVRDDGGERRLNTDDINPGQTASSFAYIAGLNMGDSSTTPVAFTRGLGTDGTWGSGRNEGVYGSDGGHIVFLGGNVEFYRNLGQTPDQGRLVDTDGNRTNNILETITDSRAVYALPPDAIGEVAGEAGTGN